MGIKELLGKGGKIAGVLFDKEFEHQGSPFGGCKTQYVHLFENDLAVKVCESCYNSFSKRAGTELYINLVKI